MGSGSGWNLWVWLTGGGCGWNLWVWLVGIVVRRHIDFFILLIPTPGICFFCGIIPTFCSFCKKFLFFIYSSIFYFLLLLYFVPVSGIFFSSWESKKPSNFPSPS